MCTVSIVLPTYNRALFLEHSLQSIFDQSFKDWELIIVDDGSTDNSVALLERLLAKVTNKTTLISQPNGGPASARNTGIANASGEFIAFYDSDDVWLPEHLTTCVNALRRNKTIDWVYAACKRVNTHTHQVIEKNSFYHNNGSPKALFDLHVIQQENVHIIDDNNAATVSIINGIESSFQTSLIKREVFNTITIPNFRIGEDRLFIVMALKAGFTLAYIDDVHLIYSVHDENISDTDPNANIDKRIGINETLVATFLSALENIPNLNKKEIKAIKIRASEELFWTIGYAILWVNGYKKEAIKRYSAALKLRPYNLSFWKTYILAQLKSVF